MDLSSVRSNVQKCLQELYKLKRKSCRIYKVYRLTQNASIGFMVTGALVTGTGITISTFGSGLITPIILGTAGASSLTIGTVSSFGCKTFNRKHQKEVLDRVNHNLDLLIASISALNNSTHLVLTTTKIRNSLMNDEMNFNRLNDESSVYSQIFLLIGQNCSSDIIEQINILFKDHLPMLNFIDECKQVLLKHALKFSNLNNLGIYLIFETWSLCSVILFKEEKKLSKKIQDIIDILKKILKNL